MKSNKFFIPIISAFIFLIGLLNLLINIFNFITFTQIIIIIASCAYIILALHLARYKMWAHTAMVFLFILTIIFNIYQIFHLLGLYSQVNNLAPTDHIEFLIFIEFLNLILNIFSLYVLQTHKILFKK